jgi:PAS domain S-box-containing protein
MADQRTRSTQKAEDLAYEKARAEALFDSIGEPVLATNEQGEIMKVNDALLDILGYTAAELIGKGYLSTIQSFSLDGSPIPPLARPVMRSLMEGRSITDKLQFAKKNGDLIPVIATVAPIMLDERPIGTIEIFRDITREQEIDRAKTEFLSLASHQLRTPATAVKQYVGMLREGYIGKLATPQRQAIDHAYEANERQLRIIEDLLRVAKVDSGKMNLHRTPTDLSELLQDVIADQAESVSHRQQTIAFTPPQEQYIAMVDAHLIRTVIENLIDNASKYSPLGKRISIELQHQKSSLSIAISDEGVGIAQSDVPKLFQKFTRLPNPLSLEANGSGLGLYWAKKVLDYHGGAITVYSTLGSGSTFMIILPER